MPRTYEQINQYEREIIAQMGREQRSWAAIGRKLGRPASAAWREYQRNRESDGQYFAGPAHVRGMERRRKARRPRVIAGQKKSWIAQRLKRCWSPDQICGRAVIEGEHMPSAMSIYRFIDRPDGRSCRKYLRFPDRKKRRRRQIHQRIHERVLIDDRPPEVAGRMEPGHWEADTVRGPVKTSACVMTVVERVSQYLAARLLRERKANQLNRAMAQSMNTLPAKTVTVDNGMEFAGHREMQKQTGISVFFAHEKCPWERGLNEQINGLLRQFFPKGTDFGKISPAQLRRAVSLINNRPRKTLGYLTPSEVMQSFNLCT